MKKKEFLNKMDICRKKMHLDITDGGKAYICPYLFCTFECPNRALATFKKLFLDECNQSFSFKYRRSLIESAEMLHLEEYHQRRILALCFFEEICLQYKLYKDF